MEQTPRWPRVLDTSYGNDASQHSFVAGDKYGRWVFKVWDQGEDRSTWEYPDEPRYTVEQIGWASDLEHALDQFDSGGEVILETNRWRKVEALFTY